jgi:hypothetical protein
MNGTKLDTSHISTLIAPIAPLHAYVIDHSEIAVRFSRPTVDHDQLLSRVRSEPGDRAGGRRLPELRQCYPALSARRDEARARVEIPGLGSRGIVVVRWIPPEAGQN